ncbi:MAG: VOC family protein [Thermomicrobiales bacterium]|nr:VOC family protein [Thermomicrobiales bacterium]
MDSQDAPSQAISLSTIGQISMRAHDVDRAVAFYRDILGVPFIFQSGDLAFFDCDGTRLLISRPELPEFDHPGSILYFRVADINATYAALKSRDVTFIDEPHLIARMPDHELWMAFFKDSEDNTLALMCEVR